MSSEAIFQQVVAKTADEHGLPLEMEDGLCVFEVDGLTFQAEVVEADKALLLSVPIGKMEATDRPGWGQAMLARSLDKPSCLSGYALDRERGLVLLLRPISVADCQDDGFYAALTAFLAEASEERRQFFDLVMAVQESAAVDAESVAGAVDDETNWIRG
ncbi:MAG: type III secretion system chaperone [Pseudomonadota bacterium]